MLPTLFEIALPTWRLPLAILGPAVVLVAVALWHGLAQKWPAWRSVVVAALLAGVVGWWGRGRVLALHEIRGHSYGVSLAVGGLLAWFMIRDMAARHGRTPSEIDRVFAAAALGSLLGSRFAYVLVHAGEAQRLWDALNVREGGHHVAGAIAGAWGGIALTVRAATRRREWLDDLAPGALVALGVARIGDYLHGSYFGAQLPSGSPRWMATLGEFPRWPAHDAAYSGSGAWLRQVSEQALPIDATRSLPVHPIQIYESALAIAAAALLVWQHERRPFPGTTFLGALFAYATIRLGMDWLSADFELLRLGPAGKAPYVACIAVAWLLATFWLGLGRSLPRRTRWAATAVLVPVCVLPALLRPDAFGVGVPAAATQLLSAATLCATAYLWHRWNPAEATGPAPAP